MSRGKKGRDFMTDTKENIRCAEEKAFRENYRKMPTESEMMFKYIVGMAVELFLKKQNERQ